MMVDAQGEQDTGSNLRHPVWRGRQPVVALWFSSEWLSPVQRDQRLLDAWTAGSRAWRYSDGDLVCLPEARWMNCADAPGLPLCRIDGLLQAGPLTPRERARIAAVDLILVQGAQPVPRCLADAQVLDLSTWIDIRQYALQTTYDLRVPVPPLVLPKLDGQRLREILGEAIPPRSSDSEAFLRKLHGQTVTEASAPGRLSTWWRDVIPGVGLSVAAYLGQAAARTAHNGAPAHGQVPARRRPSLPSAWRSTLARLSMVTRVSRVFGYRQGAHLRRMMAMFERGDLQEGLRHALPLGRDGGLLGPAFGTPGRRDSLSVGATRSPGTGIGLDDALLDHLRRTYRAAFETLDRAGRVDEAVFVLAELLEARQEALDYLVRRERPAQAAELALGWDMSSALVIRLLMLAGDRERALLVARRDGAFGDAIALLQEGAPALADALRLAWGHARVQQGDWIGAVDAVWPVAAGRDLAVEWLLAAERAGTVLSARALVQRAVLLPQTLEHYAARIEALADFHADPQARNAVADALIDTDGRSSAIRAMASHLLPALAADRSVGRAGWPPARLQRLLKVAGNAVLNADVPGWDELGDATPSVSGALELPVAITAPDVGLHTLHDVAWLPGGRFLVALGEAGAVVLDEWGKVQQRFAVPTFNLVMAHSGQVALAVTPREQVSRVARLDLATCTVTELGSLALNGFAPAYDGLGWTVLVDDRVLVVDAGKHVNDVLWHVDLPGKVVAAGFFAAREVFLIRQGDALQEWAYHVPARRRAAQRDLVATSGHAVLACPEEGMLQPRVVVAADGRMVLMYERQGQHCECTLAVLEDALTAPYVQDVRVLAAGILVHLRWPSLGRSYLVRTVDAQCMATVEWPGDAQVSAREQPGRLLLHDLHGRWVQLETADGSNQGMRLAHV
ncbi:bpX6 domain-containing protein [Stenotrophomonas rhizophila]|uniref:bpX6 domain-containing protein n=1 Tax=Stenotrophomonas rhizophila TaxID=216778 RepID=UPI002A6B3832|nr:bpX6 domain-containing protein [Stenotrophomonas rhizophila]MDY0954827.1 bpX6 domain-containing protein [Stenotrophomonas rhizophila]